MTQRQITHPEPIPACPKGHPARLIHDQRRPAAGGGYFVECRCCATHKEAATGGALAAWTRMHGFRRKRTAMRQPGQLSIFVHSAGACPPST